MTQVQAESIGINIRVAVGTELPLLESAVILVKYPDGTTHTWTPDSIDVEEGYLNYSTAEGDLDIPGDYTFQSYVVFSDGEERYGEPAIYKIFKNQVSTS